MYVHYPFILCSAYFANEQTMFMVKNNIHALFKLYSNFTPYSNLFGIKEIQVHTLLKLCSQLKLCSNMLEAHSKIFMFSLCSSSGVPSQGEMEKTRRVAYCD